MPASTTAVRCHVTVEEVDHRAILRLPEAASRRLPSRGQVAVHGTADGRPLRTVLEPDGAGGHWLRVEHLGHGARRGIGVGDTVTLELEVSEAWPEPTVPADLEAALTAAPPAVQTLWREITPMARWEWVRWVNATRNPTTRSRRVEVTISKMESGKRRPCCFNLAACTDPDLSRSGRLPEPSTRA